LRLLKLVLKNGKKIDGWVKEKSLDNTTFNDFLDANLRQLFDDELVLDCESDFQTNIVEKRLKELGWGYQKWDTGSRGVHFHLRIKGLQALEGKHIIEYRKILIQKFGSDIAKKSGWIAMEWKPHIKTGKPKTLLYKNKGEIPKIDLDIVRVIKNRFSNIYVKKYKGLNSSFAQIKYKVKVSDILSSFGIDTNSSLTMCPLGHSSVSRKCLHFEDDKGLWYCFHCKRGGDIFNLVAFKYGESVLEAKYRIEKGEY